MGWSTFREGQMNTALRFKIRWEQMENARTALKVYLWNVRSGWVKKSGETVDRNAKLTKWVYYRIDVSEWRMLNRSIEGSEWDMKDRKVKLTEH